MNLIQFNGCKTLSVIIILFVLLIYYQPLFKSFGHFYQRLNATESIATLALNNENDVTATSKRIKRFLIFQGGGVVKLVFGTSYPIMMTDKKRSLNYFYNFQMQYVPPITPLYWWSIYNTTTFAARTNLRKRSMDMLRHYDKSRSLIYEFLETILERYGNIGNECVLKIICELARAPLIDDENEIVDGSGRDIYHKLINTIFTPLYPNVDERYLNARAAGQNGANCDETFGECLLIGKWFNRFTQFV